VIDPLDIYLQGAYRDERADVDRLQAISQGLLNVFDGYYNSDSLTWPYQLVDGAEVDIPSFSFSTTAMILFALAVATGRVAKSVLVPTVRISPMPQADAWKAVADRLRPAIPTVIDAFIDRSTELGAARVTESKTFGDNDPFTLTWMLELLTAYSAQADKVIATDTTYVDRFTKIAVERVENAFNDPEGELLIIRDPKIGGTPITHGFTLLRFVQLYCLLSRRGDPVKVDLTPMRKILTSRVHLHLSLSEIIDTGFDAAELVFSLEGSLLLNPDAPDLGVIDRVFRVLCERQTQNPYWRPLRPLKVMPQGLMLLPQSVEIANSLLRICAALERDDGRSHFSENLDLFKRYMRWLEARQYKAANGKFEGWESEHTYSGNRIHLWQNSQVLLFLQHYSGMLQRHIARTALSAARIFPRLPKDIQDVPGFPPRDDSTATKRWEGFQDTEPMVDVDESSPYRVYQRIGEQFVGPRDTAEGADQKLSSSMLLYGPPGTGKSKIAEALAKALDYRLVTITPSDFISAGEASVEARAKGIFIALQEQDSLVVLFDEIDQLLLDRETEAYGKQGDLFKLLTPGMLTKLNDLSKQRRNVYVIATNYFERIDKAIKRPGRIHASYLVLPPSRAKRVKYLRARLQAWGDVPSEDAIAERTVLCTYQELKDLAGAVRRETGISADTLPASLDSKSKAMPAALTYLSYQTRFGDLGVPRPLEEFGMVVYLALESGSVDKLLWIRDAVEAAEKEIGDDDVVRTLKVWRTSV
jgi:hypothetical protein